MENYKKTLRLRIALLMIPICVAVGLGVYDVFFASEAVRESYIFGFQCGAATALGLMSVALVIYFRRILGDDTKLKLQYNKEHDERLKAVRAKAGMPMLLVTSCGMLVAGIIVGYVNTTVFITLVAAAACQMFIGGVVKQIHLRKM